MAIKQRLTFQETGLLYRQLAYLIASGAPPGEAIAILHAESESGKVRRVLDTVLSRLEQGASISESLSSQPRHFNETLVYLMTSNHDKDKVAAFLYAYADEVERSSDVRLGLFQTMIYPVKIILFAAIILAILMIFVLPVFEDFFAGMHAELPRPTKMLVHFSTAISGYAVLIVIAMVGALILFMRYKQVVYQIGMWLPGIRSLIRDLSIYSFSKYLGLLLQLDRPLPESMRYAALLVQNRSYGEKIIAASKQTNNVDQFKEQAKANNLFPNLFYRTLSIGERTLTLDQSLAELARFYHRRIAKQIEIYHNILEVAAIMFVGFMVGSIVLSMYLPIFKVAGSV